MGKTNSVSLKFNNFSEDAKSAIFVRSSDANYALARLTQFIMTPDSDKNELFKLALQRPHTAKWHKSSVQAGDEEDVVTGSLTIRYNVDSCNMEVETILGDEPYLSIKLAPPKDDKKLFLASCLIYPKSTGNGSGRAAMQISFNCKMKKIDVVNDPTVSDK